MSILSILYTFRVYLIPSWTELLNCFEALWFQQPRWPWFTPQTPSIVPVSFSSTKPLNSDNMGTSMTTYTILVVTFYTYSSSAICSRTLLILVTSTYKALISAPANPKRMSQPQGLGFRVQGLRCRAYGSGFRDLGFRVWGFLGFRV